MAQNAQLCEELEKDKTYAGKTSFEKLEAGKSGWVFRTKTDYKNNFKVNSALENRFMRLYAALQKHNIDLMIAPIPTRGMMHSDKVLDHDFKSQDAISSYTNLVEKMRQVGFTVADINDFSGAQGFYYKADHHWNAAGARQMAKRTAQEIKEIESFQSIQKEKFITEVEKQTDFKGTFADFIAKQCKTAPLIEKAPIYKTFKKDTNEDDLFGDAANPEIILLGTSNSSPKPSYANFEGFLKEYIGADILNMSVSGGGVETAALDYFNGAQHIDDKPKILIWEIPIYQNFKGGPLYRQLIPAIHGACKGNAVFEQKIALKGKNFSIPLTKSLPAKGHYMVLSFSDLKERKFKVGTHYKEGGHDDFNLRLSKYAKTLGTHFIEFDQNSDKSVEEIKGALKVDGKGSLTLSVCRYP